jgi:ABC-2 type transport system permease protein
VISFRALFRWFNPSAYVATKVVAPIEELLVFGLLARYAGDASTVAYMLIGNCLVQVCLGGLAAANTVAEERGLGSLPLLLASPVNRLVNFLQRGTVHILDSLVSVVAAFWVAAAIFHVPFGRTNWAAVAVAVGVATLSTVCLGLMFGAFALAYSNFFLVLNLLWLLMLLVTGVNIPVSHLPQWLQPLSAALPFTRSLHAAREAIAGAPLAAVAGPLLGEVALGACYLALGYAMLVALERLAWRRGTLELT